MAAMTRNEAYFTRSFEKAFGKYCPEDEGLHLEVRDSQPGYALTETQYFSFSVPEQNVQAYLYVWYHPNLNVVSGGAIVFRGVKAISLGSELFDYQNYLPATQLRGSLTNYTLDNSYSVELVEAPHTFRVRYHDPSRDNAFDVLLTPFTQPRVWPGNGHLDQIMRTHGTLSLRGQAHRVDGFGFRNRSWAEQRSETPIAFPPFARLTGVVGENFTFSVAGFDDPELGPIWKDRFTVSQEKVLKFGWVEANGELAPVVRARMLTRYDGATLLPHQVELEMTDVMDRTFRLSGEMNAATPINTWLNIRTVGGQMRWTRDGVSGWGEFINAQGNDFLFRYQQE